MSTVLHFGSNARRSNNISLLLNSISKINNEDKESSFGWNRVVFNRLFFVHWYLYSYILYSWWIQTFTKPSMLIVFKAEFWGYRVVQKCPVLSYCNVIRIVQNLEHSFIVKNNSKNVIRVIVIHARRFIRDKNRNFKKSTYNYIYIYMIVYPFQNK